MNLQSLPNAKAQKVFDFIARHLLTQNARARNVDSIEYTAGADKMLDADNYIDSAREIVKNAIYL